MKFAPFCLIALLSLQTLQTSVCAQEKNAAASASNQFGFDCFNLLKTKNETFALSPYSAWMALAMASAGANGTTLGEMQKTLQLSKASSASTFKQSAAWMKQLNEIKSCELRSANRLWVDRSMEIEKEYSLLLADDFQAGLATVDFRKKPDSARATINEWIAKQTSGRIRDLILPGMITEDTRLALTNAVYFKGEWDLPFEANSTLPASFTPSDGEVLKVSMMSQESQFGYFENNSFQAIELPYKGNELSMIVLLPKKGAKISFEPSLLGQIQTHLKTERVDLKLPRFKIESRTDFIPLLKELGMEVPFTDQADFTGISQTPLFIGVVSQRIYVKVSEKGTEAAAATVVMMTLGAAIDETEPKHFVADHPFDFFILHKATGGILFAGHVENPQ